MGRWAGRQAGGQAGGQVGRQASKQARQVGASKAGRQASKAKARGRQQTRHADIAELTQGQLQQGTLEGQTEPGSWCGGWYDSWPGEEGERARGEGQQRACRRNVPAPSPARQWARAYFSAIARATPRVDEVRSRIKP